MQMLVGRSMTEVSLSEHPDVGIDLRHAAALSRRHLPASRLGPLDVPGRHSYQLARHLNSPTRSHHRRPANLRQVRAAGSIQQHQRRDLRSLAQTKEGGNGVGWFFEQQAGEAARSPDDRRRQRRRALASDGSAGTLAGEPFVEQQVRELACRVRVQLDGARARHRATRTWRLRGSHRNGSSGARDPRTSLSASPCRPAQCVGTWFGHPRVLGGKEPWLALGPARCRAAPGHRDRHETLRRCRPLELVGTRGQELTGMGDQTRSNGHVRGLTNLIWLETACRPPRRMRSVHGGVPGGSEHEGGPSTGRRMATPFS